MNDMLPQRTSIPLVDLKAQRRALGGEVDAAMLRVLERCDFILGEDVRLFESEFADRGQLHCDEPHWFWVYCDGCLPENRRSNDRT
jgi:hypothetical protein